MRGPAKKAMWIYSLKQFKMVFIPIKNCNMDQSQEAEKAIE